MKSSPRKQVKSRRKAVAGDEAKSSPGLFPIVGIGASAGGLEAFSELLRSLPELKSWKRPRKSCNPRTKNLPPSTKKCRTGTRN